ncbi:MAG: TerB family tellurite resistance protein [Pseudomonadota bacterium]
MLSKLFPRFRPTPDPLPQPNAQLALGALLVRVAFADREYHATEIGQIDRILAKTFDLGPIDAAKLRATCEALERHAPGTSEFTEIVRNEVPYRDRLALAEGLWAVALADGDNDPAEEELVQGTEAALGLTADDMVSVRERALGSN